jgi:hypothetical protein
MNSFYKKQIREKKEDTDRQIVGGGGVEDYATYRYLIGKSAGLEYALEILENSQIERLNDNQ